MSTTTRLSRSLLAATFAVAGATPLLAQQPAVRLPRPSPKASVTQTIGVTDVTITYSRPAVKGRTIFGDPPAAMAARAKGEETLDDQNARVKGEPIVPYGHVWRAGANEATMFVVTDDVLVNGQKLAAGSYSLHAVPGKTEWTLVFNGVANQWGSFNYDPAKDTLRVKAKPEATADSQESMEFSFPAVTANTATAVLRWEKVKVPFTVEVPNVEAVWRGKADAAIAADPTNEALPLQVANAYGNEDRYDEALSWVDKSIKVKETFRNLSARANILWAAGRKAEALAAADVALAKGKAEGADTTNFEKRVATMKAGKS